MARPQRKGIANKMKVAFGVTVLARGLAHNGVDGIGRYTAELLDELIQVPGNDVYPYSFGTPIDLAALELQPHMFEVFSYEFIRAALLPKYRISSPLANSAIDLVHAGDHLVPFVKGVPLVCTIMDAIPLSNPEWVRQSLLGRLKIALWRAMARRSDHILTISEYAKTEITKYFGIEPSRISVVLNGVGEDFFEIIPEVEREKTRIKHKIAKPYFLFTGTLQPRKNISRMLDAMLELPEHIRKSHMLLLVGRDGWSNDALIERIREAEREGWCMWLGHVPNHDLKSLLQSAVLFVFPSLSEGFGLPVLEAFASKIPVIASNTTSIPEVAGDCALLIDPLDPKDIARAITNIVQDQNLAKTLVRKGHKRAKNMTWKQCAEQTVAVYQKVIENYRR